MNFEHGTVDENPKTDTNYVRCVRDPLNFAPFIDAGDDITRAVGTIISLNGSAEDPEGDALIINWSIISKPADSASELVDSDTLTPTLTLDVIGNYEVELSVSDGIVSNTDIVSIYALTLPDTGQTQSYTDTYGEDSDYTINAPSYTINYDTEGNEDGTITDNNTGLIWEKEFTDDEYDWSEAVAHCDDLILANKTDWRLPNTRELVSIVNYGEYKPAIDENFFPDIGSSSSSHWASDEYQNDANDAWDVDFQYGEVDENLKSDGNYVRCVRGVQTVNDDYTDNGDGTVTDHVTGLIWQQEDDDIRRDWENALSYCEGLTLGGHSDWRLPDIRELESIVDRDTYSPAINTSYFSGTDHHYYWSSTTYYAGDTYYAWLVYFYIGDVSFLLNKTYNCYVRCVRGGQ